MRIKCYSCTGNQKNSFTITIFPAEIRTGHLLKKKKKDLEEGCTNPGCQISQATKFCTVAPNICQSSAQRLFHVTFPVPRILRWSPGFWKTSATLLYNITATSACSVVLI